MKFNTKTIHAGQKPEETSGAVMPPIFQTSTYAQEAPNKHQGMIMPVLETQPEPLLKK